MNVEQLETRPAGLHLWFDQVAVQFTSADELRVLFCEPPKAWRFIRPDGAVEVPVYLDIDGRPQRIGTQPLARVLELLRLLEELRDRQAGTAGVQ
ncbi:MAG: hypothetical protein IT496_01640 [Gammaproteobacteria bacterium]|nr:hypothetical protein [Gammaproteobacteria bacterium]